MLLPNELASGVLVQLALQPSLKAVYSEILSPEGMELFMARASQYAAVGEELTFATLYSRARARGEVCLGYRRVTDARPVLNPDMATRIKLGPGDKLVMLGDAF